jgi:SAM-dependent methyltransferase
VTEQRRPATSIRPGFAREDWNERYAQKELVWTAEPNRRFAAEVDGLEPGRALDLACGEGRNAVWLAERGWRVTGVDFSDVALAKAAELAASRGVEAEWVVADVLDYRPEPRAFDLVAVLYLQLPCEWLPPRSPPAGQCSSSVTTRRTSRTATAGRRTRPSSTRPRTYCRRSAT